MEKKGREARGERGNTTERQGNRVGGDSEEGQKEKEAGGRAGGG